jgi:hypothetical protein
MVKTKEINVLRLKSKNKYGGFRAGDVTDVLEGLELPVPQIPQFLILPTLIFSNKLDE